MAVSAIDPWVTTAWSDIRVRAVCVSRLRTWAWWRAAFSEPGACCVLTPGSGGVVVASEYMRLELERAGVATELISVAPPYAAPRAGPPPSATGRRVAMIGRMVHPDKGVEPLLDALAAVLEPV